MRSTAIVLIAGLGVGGSHALLLRRLVAHQPSSVGVMRLVRGALALRLLLLAMLLSAGLLASAEGILIALAGLWVGRTAMVVRETLGSQRA